MLGYLDLLLLVLGAPIMLAIGVSASGYGIGAAAWILLRLVGVGLERSPALHRDARVQISTRMGYMLGRLFLLALAIIAARSGAGRGAGLAALAVIVFAFTVQLVVSTFNRPGRV